MEVQSKQKHKKRRTRRNLNELRRRSRIEVKNNMNPSKLHIKCSNIEQITSKRLTLSLFNKTIKSETITRIPLSRVNHKISNNFNDAYNGKENIDVFCKQFQKPINTSSKSVAVRKTNNITAGSFKPLIEPSRSVHIDENNTSNSPTLFSPLNKLAEDSVFEISFEEYRQEYLTHMSYSSSNEESEKCLYEKFMNDLPKYLTEHFPVFNSGIMNKNIAYLRQSYLEQCHQESQSNTLKYTNNNFALHSPQNYRDALIQKHMDNIQERCSWQQGIEKQENLFVSSSSSPLLQFGSNSNSTFVEDSPEYLFFPHKLNQ